MNSSKQMSRTLRIAAGVLARDQAAFAGPCFIKACGNQAVAVIESFRRSPPRGICEDCIPLATTRGNTIRREPLALESLVGAALPLPEGWQQLVHEKPCSTCKVRKPLSEFHRRARNSDQLSSRCKSCDRQNYQAWKTANPEAPRTSGAQSRQRRRQLVISHYGGRCACCGEDRLPFLAVDHINGGGSAHRRAIKYGGQNFYMWLIQQAFPEGYRVLCHNCNSAYGFYGKCPHQDSQAGAAPVADRPATSDSGQQINASKSDSRSEPEPLF